MYACVFTASGRDLCMRFCYRSWTLNGGATGLRTSVWLAAPTYDALQGEITSTSAIPPVRVITTYSTCVSSLEALKIARYTRTFTSFHIIIIGLTGHHLNSPVRSLV